MGGIEKHTIMNYARMHQLICVFFGLHRLKIGVYYIIILSACLKQITCAKNKDYDESEQL